MYFSLNADQDQAPTQSAATVAVKTATTRGGKTNTDDAQGKDQVRHRRPDVMTSTRSTPGDPGQRQGRDRGHPAVVGKRRNAAERNVKSRDECS